MTRRDTIIIAVFINAAILIALFVSAMRSGKSDDKELAALPETSQKVMDLPLAKAEVKPELKPVEVAAPQIKTAEGDEVDLVLKQFAQSAPQLAQNAQPEAIAAQPAASVDFAQDLQALMVDPAASQVASVAPAQTVASVIEVTVKKGDVLEKIARAHKTTVREIMRLNNLKNANLKIGQVLKVSQGNARQKPAATPAVIKSEGAAKYYTVKNGDNPWTIAVKNQMKLEELLRLNNMDEQKARRLKAGDKIRIQ